MLHSVCSSGWLDGQQLSVWCAGYSWSVVAGSLLLETLLVRIPLGITLVI